VTDETPPETAPRFAPGTLPGEGPTEKIESTVDAPDPVFVDDSGKRGKRIRMAFYALGGLGLTYAALVAVSLAGGPLTPESLLPFPEKFVKPATTPVMQPIGDAAQARAKAARGSGTPRPGDHNTAQPAKPGGPAIPVNPVKPGNPIVVGPAPSPAPSTSKPVEGASDPAPPASSAPPAQPSTAPPASPAQSRAPEAGPVATGDPTVAEPARTTKAPEPIETSTVAAPAGGDSGPATVPATATGTDTGTNTGTTSAPESPR
jgi:hypothetical protein